MTSKIEASPEATGQAVERDQFFGIHAGPHQRPFVSFDKDFGNKRAGVVGTRLDRAIGTGGHHRQKVAGIHFDERTAKRQETA